MLIENESLLKEKTRICYHLWANRFLKKPVILWPTITNSFFLLKTFPF